VCQEVALMLLFSHYLGLYFISVSGSRKVGAAASCILVPLGFVCRRLIVRCCPGCFRECNVQEQQATCKVMLMMLL
jgi:hypothetical protein